MTYKSNAIVTAYRTAPRSMRQRRAGFSLVEVMIAMGIFAVGFISVASLFPVSIVLQRETVLEIEAQLVSRNAKAMVAARELTFQVDLNAGQEPAAAAPYGQLDLRPFSSIPYPGGRPLATRWTMGDRSYPTSEAQIVNRKFFWAPFIRKTKLYAPAAAPPSIPTAADYMVLAFVMRRDQNRTYVRTAGAGGVTAVAYPNDDAGQNRVPRVVQVAATAGGSIITINPAFPLDQSVPADGVPDQVRVGDWLADNRGYFYQVTGVEVTGNVTIQGSVPFPSGRTATATADEIPPVTHVWFGPPATPEDTSPLVHIILLGSIVQD